MAGYALGFVMGATSGPRFAFYSKCLRRPRMGPPKGSYGNCVPMPPGTPAPGHRRVYFDMPSTIAECGGPCSFGGPEFCDCGALWCDEPIRLDPGRVQRGNGTGGPAMPKPDIIPKPQFPSPRIIPGDTP